jgi:hypothetical protein
MIDLFISWYFFEIPGKIKKIWINYLWFFAKYFALAQLALDYFGLFKGLAFKREKRSFDPGDALSAMFGNLISRIIGATMRSFFLIIGLGIELAVFLGGFLAFAAWVVFIPGIFYSLARGLMILARI